MNTRCSASLAQLLQTLHSSTRFESVEAEGNGWDYWNARNATRAIPAHSLKILKIQIRGQIIMKPVGILNEYHACNRLTFPDHLVSPCDTQEDSVDQIKCSLFWYPVKDGQGSFC